MFSTWWAAGGRNSLELLLLRRASGAMWSRVMMENALNVGVSIQKKVLECFPFDAFIKFSFKFAVSCAEK